MSDNPYDIDPFRAKYRELTAMEQEDLEKLKKKARELWMMLDLQSGREIALAKTKLEESVMWAVKGMTG